MVYADTNFFLALIKKDDWLGEKARKALEEYEDKLKTSLPTFIEIMFLSEDYDWDLYRAFSYITEIAEVDHSEEILLQAVEFKEEEGFTTIDAFQAALTSGSILSSDQNFDKIEAERIKLEKNQ